MSTPSQTLASQANGAKSHGPVTPEGRGRSSQNSLKHGLSSSVVVLSGESGEKFNAMLAGFTETLGPRSEIERELVFEMAASLWRLRRASRLEVVLLDTEIAKLQNEPENVLGPDAALATAFLNLVAKGGPLAKLYTHESRLRRAYDKAARELERLQAAADELLAPSAPERPLPSSKRKNEPEPVDLRTVFPHLRYPGGLDKLLHQPRVRAVLDPQELHVAA
jgi:hypothetical protein